MNQVIRVSVAANSTSLPLAGTMVETMPFDGIVELAMNQQSGAINDVLATVTSGSDVISDEGPISANARLPLYPEDFLWSDVAAAGEKLMVRLRNTTAGAIVVVLAVRINPA